MRAEEVVQTIGVLLVVLGGVLGAVLLVAGGFHISLWLGWMAVTVCAFVLGCLAVLGAEAAK